MINREYLYRFAKEQCIAKGEDLYYAGNVGNIHAISISSNTIKYTATVISSRRSSQYITSFSHNQTSDTILNYTCSCPFTNHYYEPCKHVVATIFKFINATQNIVFDETSTTLAGITTTHQQTSADLKAVIKHFEESYLKTIYSSSIEYISSIHLTPILTLDISHSEFQLELTIRGNKTHEYIIKSIRHFLTLIEKKECFSYGKHLNFQHTLEIFDSNSQKLIQFLFHYRDLIDAVKTHGNNNINFQPSMERSISLRNYFVDEFFSQLHQQNILIHIQKITYHCTLLADKKPNLSLSIRKEDTGFILKRSKYMAFSTLKNTYIFIFCNANICNIYQIKENGIKQQLIQELSNTNEQMYLSNFDLGIFVQKIFPELKKYFKIKQENINLEEYIPNKPSYVIYIDTTGKEAIVARLEVSYGTDSFNILDTEDDHKFRDIFDEQKTIFLVKQYFPETDKIKKNFRLENNDYLLYKLLTHGITTLNQYMKVYASDHFRNIQVKRKPHINIGLSVHGNLLEFSLQSEELSNQEIAEILSKYDKKTNYFRLKNGNFIELDDKFDDLKSIQKNLQLTKKQIQTTKLNIPSYRALYFDSLQQKNNTLLTFKQNNSFQNLVHNMKQMNVTEHTVPVTINATLRNYQRQGYSWLKNLKNNHFCGLLADEMGLGKTLQVITFLDSLKQRGKTLIVTPASLVYNWVNEFKNFAPHLPVVAITGPNLIRGKIIKNTNRNAIIITSYSLLQKDLDYYKKIHFTTQIIDEAQYIKNANTLNAHAVKNIQSSFRIALTGTPIENRLSELWSIFDYLMPGFLFTYDRFKHEFEQAITMEDDNFTAKELQSMISPFVLRRLKKDVLNDLPDKIEEEIHVQLEAEQKQLYDARVQHIKNRIAMQSNEEFRTGKLEILAELTYLRMLCCSPSLVYKNYHGNSAKEALCIELVKSAVESGHKVLIFSQFTSMIDILSKRLKKNNISHYILTGTTPKQKRIELVNAFQNDDTKVFCISLKAGGTGLNLTAADIVIHYDPWWNTAVETQASDRVHRIGQKNTVSVYRIIVEKTLEEKIVNLQKTKKELSSKILSGKEIASTILSREELLNILT